MFGNLTFLLVSVTEYKICSTTIFSARQNFAKSTLEFMTVILLFVTRWQKKLGETQYEKLA